MKKIFLTLCLTSVFGVAMAQQNISTYSIYDTNQSGDLSVSDVTGVVDVIRANTSPIATPQYVTAEDLHQLLSEIESRLLRTENLSANPGTPETPKFDDIPISGTTYHVGESGAIDLGLSVKWAACNIGANLPSRIGDYFAWGENVSRNDGKYNFDWDSYFYTPNHDGESFIKYKNSAKNSLDLSDDVAHAKMEGTWRMPTKAEADELVNNCTWIWATVAGALGYIVVGLNGNAIFLPATSAWVGTDFPGITSGYYWTSSLDTSDDSSANALYFESGTKSVEGGPRCWGFCIRPVCQ